MYVKIIIAMHIRLIFRRRAYKNLQKIFSEKSEKKREIIRLIIESERRLGVCTWIMVLNITAD